MNRVFSLGNTVFSSKKLGNTVFSMPANGLGCGPCDAPNGLGDIDHSGFVTLGAIEPSTTTGGEIGCDIGVGLFAFIAPILYDKIAPKKWPHAKKTWQDVAAVVGVYFLSTYLIRKVI